VGTAYAASLVRNYLRRELEKRGFDAFDVPGTVADLQDRGGPEADYYVELVGDGDSEPYGGIGIGDRHAGVDIAVVVSRVAASVSLYDGRTLEQLDTFDLQRRNTTVLPTSIGVGGRHVGLWIAVPFVQWGRYKSAARAVASRLGWPWALLDVEADLAVAVAEAGEPERAVELLRDVERRAAAARFGTIRRNVLVNVAACLLRSGRAEEAAAACDVAAQVAEQAGSSRHLATARGLQADAYLSLGQLEPARAAIDQAIETKRKARDSRIALTLMRRAAILGLALLAYAYHRNTITPSSLASIGLLAFAAFAQVAPPILAGLYWRRATRRAGCWGLMTGFATVI
jgi:tetratricopeptide (TPR) repeat protein